jgi:hypothetical protein
MAFRSFLARFKPTNYQICRGMTLTATVFIPAVVAGVVIGTVANLYVDNDSHHKRIEALEKTVHDQKRLLSSHNFLHSSHINRLLEIEKNQSGRSS